QFDAFAELQRAAPDLDRAAWVAGCLDAPDVAERYVCQNAFGQPYPHRLNPAHPAVRDYVVNLCSDLAHRYDLAAVVLEEPGWLPPDRGEDREHAAAPLDRWARALLALCFAETTRRAARAAGVDAEALQALAREWLEGCRAPGAATGGMAAAWRFADLIGDPAWAQFLDWRSRHVASLVSDVRAVLPADTALVVIPAAPHRGAAPLEGCDLALLARAADALEIPVWQASTEEMYLDARDVRRRAGEEAALRFVLRPPGAPLADDEADAEVVGALGEIGIGGLAFYSYARMRLSGPAPVRAAFQRLDAAGSRAPPGRPEQSSA